MIIGGAGFIGLNIANYLKDYYNVYILDHFYNNDFNYIYNKFKNCLTIIKLNCFEIYKYEYFLKEYNIDIIIDCINNIKYNNNNKIEKIYENVNNYIQFLELYNKYNIHLIYISTLNCYNIASVSDYIINKLNIEYNIIKYKNLKKTIMRIGSVYGYNLNNNPKGVINCFIDNLYNNKDIIIYDKMNNRNFLQLDDLSLILLKFINYDIIDDNNIYNFNGIYNIKIIDIAKWLITYFNNKNLKFIYNDYKYNNEYVENNYYHNDYNNYILNKTNNFFNNLELIINNFR